MDRGRTRPLLSSAVLSSAAAHLSIGLVILSLVPMVRDVAAKLNATSYIYIAAIVAAVASALMGTSTSSSRRNDEPFDEEMR